MLTRVLVIDDDEELTEMLKLVLEPNAFEVFTANTGSKGIELVRLTDPDVLILDLLMPDMDGWDVCRTVREFSNVPILVLSALSKPGLVARALDEGADDILTKPMPISMLIAHLKKLARRARAEQAAASTNETTDSPMNYMLQ